LLKLSVVNPGRLCTALALSMRKLLDVASACTNVSVYEVLTRIRDRRFSRLRTYPFCSAFTKICVHIRIYVVFFRLDERRKRIKRYPFTDVNVHLCLGIFGKTRIQYLNSQSRDLTTIKGISKAV